MAEHKSLLEEMLSQMAPAEKVATGEGAAAAPADPNPEQNDEDGIDGVEALSRAIKEAQAKVSPELHREKPAEAPLKDLSLRHLDERPAEMKRIRWSDDPDVKNDICGLREGSRFIMKDCGKDLDGEWEVIQLNLADADPEVRNLFAQRPKAGPPYIKMVEAAVEEEIHNGRLVVLEE